MTERLPALDMARLSPTRDFLQDTTKVVGALQRTFLPESPRDWHYGLEVTMRGIATQAFEFNGRPERALIDLVGHKVRFLDRSWSLGSTPPGELLNELQTLVGSRLKDVKLAAGILEYDPEQSDRYAAALWRMERQFSSLRSKIKSGLTSPILLYPHHFDLALTWFPPGNEEQWTIGWYTGDETVHQPYVYITTYPDAARLKTAGLPAHARWETDGFTGIVWPYDRFLEGGTPELDFISRAIDDRLNLG